MVDSMTQSASAHATDAGSNSHKPRMRLVIRAEILPGEPTLAKTPPPRSNGKAIALTLSALVGVALLWGAIGMFRAEQPGAPALQSASTGAEPAITLESSTAPRIPPAQVPVVVPAEPRSAMSVIHEVLPEPSSGALQTIRGTVRVTIRVTIDAGGFVTAVASEAPGPSRYFERLSREAARKWTFTPANDDLPRTALLRFHFTREGTTARMEDPQSR